MGNYVAVGTFQPSIEIWNLDVMDPLEPTAILGGEIVTQDDITNNGANRPNESVKGAKSDDNDMELNEADYLPGSHTTPSCVSAGTAIP